MKNLIIPNEIFIPQIKELIDEGMTTTFRVRGYSMRLFLEDRRDKVLLAPCTEAPRRGDVILAEVSPKRYVLHRVIKVDGTHLTLKGDGNVFGTEECDVNDIIGIAKGFYRKGRSVPDLTTGTKWKVYSFLWLRLTPLRRLILAFYRRIWLKVFPVKIEE